MKKHKTIQKGFTLIELLMVVALIAILSTVILIALDSGRERAELNKYFAYGTQMHKVVADSVAAGKFDKSALPDDFAGTFCLGLYSSSGCGGATIIGPSKSGDAKVVFDALTFLGDLPPIDDGQGLSPYNSDNTNNGVWMDIDRSSSGPNEITVCMYLLSTDPPFLQNKCDSILWDVEGGNSCCKKVPLHSRL